MFEQRLRTKFTIKKELAFIDTDSLPEDGAEHDTSKDCHTFDFWSQHLASKQNIVNVLRGAFQHSLTHTHNTREPAGGTCVVVNKKQLHVEKVRLAESSAGGKMMKMRCRPVVGAALSHMPGDVNLAFFTVVEINDRPTLPRTDVDPRTLRRSMRVALEFVVISMTAVTKWVAMMSLS